MSNTQPTQEDILQQCKDALDEFTRRLDEWQEETDAWDAEGKAIESETTRQENFFRVAINPASDIIEWNGSRFQCNARVLDLCGGPTTDPRRVKCEAQRRFGHITTRGEPASSFDPRSNIEESCNGFGLPKSWFNSLNILLPQIYKKNVFNNGLVSNLKVPILDPKNPPPTDAITESMWTFQKQAERLRLIDNWEARKPLPPPLPDLICQFCEQNVTVDDVLESTVQLDQLLECIATIEKTGLPPEPSAANANANSNAEPPANAPKPQAGAKNANGNGNAKTEEEGLSPLAIFGIIGGSILGLIIIIAIIVAITRRRQPQPQQFNPQFAQRKRIKNFKRK